MNRTFIFYFLAFIFCVACTSEKATEQASEVASIALAYGKVAAAEVEQAFAKNDFSYGRYKWRIVRNGVLFSVIVRVGVAKFAYRFQNKRFFKIGWSIARRIINLTPWSNPNFVPARTPAKQSEAV